MRLLVLQGDHRSNGLIRQDNRTLRVPGYPRKHCRYRVIQKNHRNKGTVEQITKVLAKELGHKHIAVNAISPGPVDTELFREGKTEAQIRNLADMAAFGRIGTPRDIADAVKLLLSDEAGWISGQDLCVNGGFVA